MIYAKSDLNSIRSKIDMLEYLEKRGMTFRQSGASWLALCPVHSERSPSFNVRPDSQTFHCFGCGISGDIFALVQEMDGLSFPGAVQELAAEANVVLQVDEDPNYKHRQRMLQITSLTSQWFRRNYTNLDLEHPAKQNLEARNLYEYSITDDSIGFAPASGLIQILTSRGFSVDELVEAGVVKLDDNGSPRERFRNRLTWTLYDIQGKPIGFSARKIYENDMGPKYINSPQTELYNKSKVLLGLADAKKAIAKEQEVYVVEGQTDVMAMKAAGKQNTVASCGTAFGTEHANLLLHLSKLGKDSAKFKIIFCFDGDEAGTKAARGIFEKNKQIQLNSHVVSILNPDNTATDPCDYRKDYGDAALLGLVSKEQTSIVEFVLRQELKQWNIETPEGQSAFITKAKEILSLITDPIQHSAYLRKVAAWTGIPFSEIGNMVRPQRYQGPQETKNAPIETTGDINVDPFETRLIASFVQYPKEALALLKEYKLDGSFFQTQKDLALTVIDQSQDKEGFDFSNPEISKLAHVDLAVMESRKEYALDFLFKGYLKHLYNIELNKLNSRLATSSTQEDSAAYFTQMLDAQKSLKERYHIK